MNTSSNQLWHWQWQRHATCAAIICFLIATYASPPLRAEEKASAATRSIAAFYDLLSNGDDIGDISVTRSQNSEAGNSLYQIEETLSIKVSGFWGKWELASTGISVINNEEFVTSDYRIKENKNDWHVLCEKHGLEVSCGARNISITEEKEGNSEEVRIPVDGFDTTSAQLVSFLMRKPGGLTNETVKVLNTAELEIETFIFAEANQEDIAVAGKTFPCRVFKTTNAKEKSTYWVAEDDLGAFLAKESGVDEDGPYEILLKQYVLSEG